MLDVKQAWFWLVWSFTFLFLVFQRQKPWIISACVIGVLSTWYHRSLLYHSLASPFGLLLIVLSCLTVLMSPFGVRFIRSYMKAITLLKHVMEDRQRESGQSPTNSMSTATSPPPIQLHSRVVHNKTPQHGIGAPTDITLFSSLLILLDQLETAYRVSCWEQSFLEQMCHHMCIAFASSLSNSATAHSLSVQIPTASATAPIVPLSASPAPSLTALIKPLSSKPVSASSFNMMSPPPSSTSKRTRHSVSSNPLLSPPISASLPSAGSMSASSSVSAASLPLPSPTQSMSESDVDRADDEDSDVTRQNVPSVHARVHLKQRSRLHSGELRTEQVSPTPMESRVAPQAWDPSCKFSGADLVEFLTRQKAASFPDNTPVSAFGAVVVGSRLLELGLVNYTGHASNVESGDTTPTSPTSFADFARPRRLSVFFSRASSVYQLPISAVSSASYSPSLLSTLLFTTSTSQSILRNSRRFFYLFSPTVTDPQRPDLALAADSAPSVSSLHRRSSQGAKTANDPVANSDPPEMAAKVSKSPASTMAIRQPSPLQISHESSRRNSRDQGSPSEPSPFPNRRSPGPLYHKEVKSQAVFHRGHSPASNRRPPSSQRSPRKGNTRPHVAEQRRQGALPTISSPTSDASPRNSLEGRRDKSIPFSLGLSQTSVENALQFMATGHDMMLWPDVISSTKRPGANAAASAVAAEELTSSPARVWWCSHATYRRFIQDTHASLTNSNSTASPPMSSTSQSEPEEVEEPPRSRGRRHNSTPGSRRSSTGRGRRKQNSTGYLCWQQADQGIRAVPVAGIVSLYDRRQTMSFKRKVCSHVPDEHCFSVVANVSPVSIGFVSPSSSSEASTPSRLRQRPAFSFDAKHESSGRLHTFNFEAQSRITQELFVFGLHQLLQGAAVSKLPNSPFPVLPPQALKLVKPTLPVVSPQVVVPPRRNSLPDLRRRRSLSDLQPFKKSTQRQTTQGQPQTAMGLSPSSTAAVLQATAALLLSAPSNGTVTPAEKRASLPPGDSLAAGNQRKTPATAVRALAVSTASKTPSTGSRALPSKPASPGSSTANFPLASTSTSLPPLSPDRIRDNPPTSTQQPVLPDVEPNEQTVEHRIKRQQLHSQLRQELQQHLASARRDSLKRASDGGDKSTELESVLSAVASFVADKRKSPMVSPSSNIPRSQDVPEFLLADSKRGALRTSFISSNRARHLAEGDQDSEDLRDPSPEIDDELGENDDGKSDRNVKRNSLPPIHEPRGSKATGSSKTSPQLSNSLPLKLLHGLMKGNSSGSLLPNASAPPSLRGSPEPELRPLGSPDFESSPAFSESLRPRSSGPRTMLASPFVRTPQVNLKGRQRLGVQSPEIEISDAAEALLRTVEEALVRASHATSRTLISIPMGPPSTSATQSPRSAVSDLSAASTRSSTPPGSRSQSGSLHSSGNIQQVSLQRESPRGSGELKSPPFSPPSRVRPRAVTVPAPIPLHRPTLRTVTPPPFRSSGPQHSQQRQQQQHLQQQEQQDQKQEQLQQAPQQQQTQNQQSPPHRNTATPPRHTTSTSMPPAAKRVLSFPITAAERSGYLNPSEAGQPDRQDQPLSEYDYAEQEQLSLMPNYLQYSAHTNNSQHYPPTSFSPPPVPGNANGFQRPPPLAFYQPSGGSSPRSRRVSVPGAATPRSVTPVPIQPPSPHVGFEYPQPRPSPLYHASEMGVYGYEPSSPYVQASPLHRTLTESGQRYSRFSYPSPMHHSMPHPFYNQPTFAFAIASGPQPHVPGCQCVGCLNSSAQPSMYSTTASSSNSTTAGHAGHVVGCVCQLCINAASASTSASGAPGSATLQRVTSPMTPRTPAAPFTPRTPSGPKPYKFRIDIETPLTPQVEDVKSVPVDRPLTNDRLDVSTTHRDGTKSPMQRTSPASGKSRFFPTSATSSPSSARDDRDHDGTTSSRRYQHHRARQAVITNVSAAHSDDEDHQSELVDNPDDDGEEARLALTTLPPVTEEDRLSMASPTSTAGQSAGLMSPDATNRPDMDAMFSPLSDSMRPDQLSDSLTAALMSPVLSESGAVVRTSIVSTDQFGASSIVITSAGASTIALSTAHQSGHDLTVPTTVVTVMSPTSSRVGLSPRGVSAVLTLAEPSSRSPARARSPSRSVVSLVVTEPFLPPLFVERSIDSTPPPASIVAALETLVSSPPPFSPIASPILDRSRSTLMGSVVPSSPSMSSSLTDSNKSFSSASSQSPHPPFSHRSPSLGHPEGINTAGLSDSQSQLQAQSSTDSSGHQVDFGSSGSSQDSSFSTEPSPSSHPFFTPRLLSIADDEQEEHHKSPARPLRAVPESPASPPQSESPLGLPSATASIRQHMRAHRHDRPSGRRAKKVTDSSDEDSDNVVPSTRARRTRQQQQQEADKDTEEEEDEEADGEDGNSEGDGGEDGSAAGGSPSQEAEGWGVHRRRPTPISITASSVQGSILPLHQDT